MKRTTQQNKLYHEFCGLLHKQKEVSVWDGRFNINPMQFRPTAFCYNGFRVILGQLDLEYPKDEEGKALSSTKLSIEQMNSHILFLEVLCAELTGE